VIDVGQVLDKYELLERVGQGGMAVVYRGMDRSLRRHVAVKVLHRHLAEHAEARDRFEREAHAVAKLHHENILEIFAYSGRESPESYIVTELIDGPTLKRAITEHPPRFAEIGALIVAQICRALGHAHAQGVLHRDVKPENVMIRSDGVVKLTDFGISQMLDAQRMTVTGQLLGSPAYMSPEHVEGNQLDFRTDVFATGIVLYQLTVGKLPFEGKNPHEILKKIADCKFADPRQVNPRIGNQLGKIIVRALARSPADRYPTVGAMLTDLEAYLAGSGLSADKEELARYFANPPGYELALGARLADHLVRRAKDEVGRDRAGALELLDRGLTIDPKHPGALELMRALERGQRGRRIATGVVVAVLAGGGAWGVRKLLDQPPRLVVVVADAGAAVDGGAGGGRDGDAPRPAAIDAGPLVVASDAASVDAPAAVPAPIDARERDLPVDGRRVEPLPRVDAGARADAAVGGPVTLIVSPVDAEIRIAGGPWQRALGGRLAIPAPATPTEVEVRRDDCCEATTRTIGPDEAGQNVRIQLGLLPAILIPRCSAPDVQVRIDGRPARLDATTAVLFGSTVLPSKTIKVEFLGERIDTQHVQVKYNETKEVHCRLGDPGDPDPTPPRADDGAPRAPTPVPDQEPTP
jgi:serine/threonine-protein kinase